MSSRVISATAPTPLRDRNPVDSTLPKTRRSCISGPGRRVLHRQPCRDVGGVGPEEGARRRSPPSFPPERLLRMAEVAGNLLRQVPLVVGGSLHPRHGPLRAPDLARL